MLLGMQESYKKGESESILAPSLTDGVARRRPKRRQGGAADKAADLAG